MVAYSTRGVYAEEIAVDEHQEINPTTNRYAMATDVMVFPCNGDYGNETAIYSRRFKVPVTGTQKCVLVDIGEDKQDIVAFRPQKVAVGDQVVLIPVHGDPNNVVCMTDMQFFKNGCFEEAGEVIGSFTTPKYWQAELKNGGSCPFLTTGYIKRTSTYKAPGTGSNYGCTLHIAEKPVGTQSEVYFAQTGPLRSMRYLSFFIMPYSAIFSTNLVFGCTIVDMTNSKYYRIFNTYTDLYQTGIAGNGLAGNDDWFYVEIDLVTALTKNGVSSAAAARTILAQHTGKFAFYAYRNGQGGTGWMWSAFDTIQATR